MDKHDTRAQGAGADGRANGRFGSGTRWSGSASATAAVAAFFTAYIAGDDAQTVHVWAGYNGRRNHCLADRLGVVGSRHARFTDFVRGPGAALAYLAAWRAARRAAISGIIRPAA